MPNFQRRFRVAMFATAGLAAALLFAGTDSSSAGPFQWLFKGNRQNEAPPGDNYDGGGGGGGGTPWFGNRGSSQDPTQQPHASELPVGDPEVMMITNPALGTPTLSSKNIAATKAAIAKYQQIVAQGGWPAVPAVVMKPGKSGPEIVTLHRRLEISGDLVGMSVPEEYDQALVAAVRKFQARHGLPATGIVDSRATVEALNVPATIRLAQLQANLTRLQKLAPTASGRYVVVNIPAAQVEAVEGGQVVLRHAAVVGKIERPTPELSSKIHEINFNPDWHVPKTIVHKDLVPKGQMFANRGQDMLAAYHMQAFDAAGNPVNGSQIDWFGPEVYNYSFRQLPWDENSLGFVKINFPNKDAVYLHDTPLKSLFGKAIRFESSGCVRVHNVEQLVSWVLRDNGGWNVSRVASMKQTREQLDVKVAKPVPIYLAYVSAWGTPDGLVNFRPDIYGHDSGPYTASAY
jgi:L,D-transpeptidase YcbB